MNQVNKTKCENGHFFNLSKFDCCPICGGRAVGITDIGKSAKPSQYSRKSGLREMDKTERLDDINSGGAPDSGKAGGIKWQFDKPKSERREPDDQKEDKPVPNGNEDRKTTEKNTEQTAQASGTGSGESGLSQAVQSTGSGRFSALPPTVAHHDFPEGAEPPTGWLVCTKGAHRGEAFACFKGRNKIGRNPDNRIIPIREESITRKSHAIITYEPVGRKFYLENGEGDKLVYHNGELLFSHTHKELQAYDQVRLENAVFVFIPLCGERFSWDEDNG